MDSLTMDSGLRVKSAAVRTGDGRGIDAERLGEARRGDRVDN